MNKNTIEEHYTHEIYDSSKVQTFMDCPRKYFYEYVLGWRREGSNIHTHYGVAIHTGFELLNLVRVANGKGYHLTEDDIGMAYTAFLQSYRQEFKPEDDEYNNPKNPERAREALFAYKLEYNAEHAKETILSTEKAGSISISDDKKLHYRQDLIVHSPTFGIIVRDYKTAKKNSDPWAADFELKIQAGTYTHVARTMANLQLFEVLNLSGVKYKEEDVYGIQFLGIFL